MLTPLDIENREFKRTLNGYNRDDVEDFMIIMLNDYETLYKENFELKDLLKRMGDELRQAQEEKSSREENVGAEKVEKNDEVKISGEAIVMDAEKQAAELVRSAQDKANQIISAANVEIDRLNEKYISSRQQIVEYKKQMESFFESQLEMLRKVIGDDAGNAGQEEIENS